METAEPAASPTPEKRLAAILSVDAVGYSARSEVDEAAAVQAVAALGRRVEAAAREHGGRVFNTAGDGFMLEFPTVSGALGAARDIAAGADPVVRIGVHLDEVAVTPKGDLLGHGVNVAARLQGLAKPGSVLVSDAVRRASPGAQAAFRPHGRVRLEKMGANAEVFTLVLGQGAAGGIRRRRPWLAPVLGGLVALVLAAVGFGVWSAAQSKDLRVAVEPLVATGDDPAARALADGMAGQITTSLADHRTEVAPEGAAATPGHGGARLLVSGEVRRMGPNLVVDLKLEDRKAGVILWSYRQERAVTEADALREQIAIKMVDVVGKTVSLMRDPTVGDNIPAVIALLKLDDMVRDDRPDSRVDLDREVLRLAPRYAKAHGQLACDLLSTQQGRPPELAKRMLDEARTEAALANTIDPPKAAGYCALMQMTPRSDFARREEVATRWTNLQPEDASAAASMASLLMDLGRQREAEPYYRRAMALDPMSPAKMTIAVYGLAGSGRTQEAWTLAQRALVLFPNRPGVRRTYVYYAILYRPSGEALKAIDTIDRMGGVFDAGSARAWRDFVEAKGRGHVDRAQAARLRQAAVSGVIEALPAMSALAQAGAVDDAFAVVEVALDGRSKFFASDLFAEDAAPMRRDPRFEALMARLGILGYWRKTGIGPDFCAEAGVPTICKGLKTNAG